MHNEQTQIITNRPIAKSKWRPRVRKVLLALMVLIVIIGTIYVIAALTGVCGEAWSDMSSCPADINAFLRSAVSAN